MRSPLLFTLLLLGTLAAVAVAWSKEDHEIFRLRDEVELNEGEGVTFYDFLGVKSGVSATQDEINKAYKKTSIRLHPDKHKPPKSLSKSAARESRKKASERFARLGLVAAILRGPGRERYDHFMRNGFPKWRGTGYYYARFRPGLGSVVIGLFLAAGVAHYGVLYLNARQQRRFMESYIREARTIAFGATGVPGLAAVLGEETGATTGTEDENGVPVPRNRKERRALASKKGGAPKTESHSGTVTPVPGDRRKRVVAENGKVFVVDDIGNVFLVHETEDGPEEYMLDVDEIQGPKWRNTLLVTLPRWFWRVSIGRVLPGGQKQKKKAEETGSESEEDGEEEQSGSSVEAAVVTRKKGTARKIERGGEGVPRRRVKARGKK